MFQNYIMAMATKLCTYTQSSKLYALNFVNSMVCKLYLNKLLKKK